MRPTAGDVIGGKYRIVRLIGDGGMGAVYEAHHEFLDTQVALKFLHPELAKRPGLGSRFLQEARVSARIRSAHVTHVTDVDQTPDGSPYLVMELLHGESLQAALDRHKKFPPEQAIDFALQILAGLESAHQLGVVHRDLKPDNVFIVPVTGGPLLKLIDFGIAKLRAATEYQKGLTRAGVVMGTPEYMAPEQLFAANDVDHRADLYSLGVILFEMLSGKRPADGDDVETIVAQVVSKNVKRLQDLEPNLPPGLIAVVDRALMPDREQRFATALEMRLALAHFAGALSQAGRLAASPEPLTPLQQPTSALSAHVAPAATPMQTGAAQAFNAERAVPKTLPPEAPEQAMLESKGSTQEVSDSEVREALRQSTSALEQSKLGYMPTAPAYGAPPQPVLRRRSRAGLWISLSVVGILLIGGGVLAAVFYQQQQTETPTPTATVALDPTAPPTTVSALVDTGGATQPPVPSSPATTTPSRPVPTTPNGLPTVPTSPTAPHHPADAGAPPGADAGKPSGFPFPFSLPSTLPPLPSTFPPLPKTFPSALPSGFPQLPGFPFGAPAPAKSSK
ncbi:MAG TPA: protein kinase [Polyangiaceae bacterium]|jgi:serine/threonine-protein kinase|nr:protein kinase [Polyangiaceae bacterium]